MATETTVTITLTGDESEFIEQMIDAIEGGRIPAPEGPPLRMEQIEDANLRSIAEKLSAAWREVDPSIDSRGARR